MPTRKRLTISSMGIRHYYDTLAQVNGNDHDYAWFDHLCDQVEKKEITRTEAAKRAGITLVIFDKHRLFRNIERVQHGKRPR